MDGSPRRPWRRLREANFAVGVRRLSLYSSPRMKMHVVFRELRRHWERGYEHRRSAWLRLSAGLWYRGMRARLAHMRGA